MVEISPSARDAIRKPSSNVQIDRGTRAGCEQFPDGFFEQIHARPWRRWWNLSRASGIEARNVILRAFLHHSIYGQEKAKLPARARRQSARFRNSACWNQSLNAFLARSRRSSERRLRSTQDCNFLKV